MDLSLLSAIAMGIGLSACCGFRVFIPMLATSLAAYFHWLPMESNLSWMGTWPAIICFGTAAILEIGAYYIPFLDNILDSIAIPLSVVAGTLVAYSIVPGSETSPLLQWGLSLIAGGASAGVIQAGTGLLRLFSTKATVGTANPVLSTGENLAAIGGSVFSFLIPVITAGCLLLLVGFILVRWIAPVISGKSID
jgi:hypothetical protein